MKIMANESFNAHQTLTQRLDQILELCEELSRIWDANTACLEERFPEQLVA